MNISENIVEATAKAMWEAMPYEYKAWEDLPHDLLTVRNLRSQARVALEAAGPPLIAQALREHAPDTNCHDDYDLFMCKADVVEAGE